LASGLRIAEALRSRGHTVDAVDTAKGPLSQDDEKRMLAGGVVKQLPPTPDELARMNAESLEDTAARLPRRGDCDVAFLALHGGRGEDGTFQALLDLAGVPYTGSGHLASALAMDKDLAKDIMRAHGVQTADWMMATDPASIPDAAHVGKTLGWPVIVKPSKQGSTVGLSIVKKPEELAPAIAEAFKHDDEVMLETFIPGRELTVSILGGEALPVGEIIAKKEIYDYECK
jgi:D-alanine-D-alanine ligase